MTQETPIHEIEETPSPLEMVTDESTIPSDGAASDVASEETEAPPTDGAVAANGTARREYRPQREREPREREPRARKARKPAPAIFERFVVIRWSGRREPVDDMFWAEATKEGEWMVLTEFEQIRSRKDILARLLELPPALVALDFPLSYPADFFEFLKGEGITDWRSLAKRVREDLKKNVDDGVRLWIERMGAYRESRLEDEALWPDRRDDRYNDRRGDRYNDRGNDRYNDRRSPLPREPLAPYERGSLAERFRRTDHALRRVADRHLVSPVQIGYNRLTNRYEFTDANSQGRAALLGMSMLDQVLDVRQDAAVWPMMAPKPLTIVEVLPWVFTAGDRLQPDVLRKQMATLEDRGWDIPSHAIDQAARNPEAQSALRCLLGMIKTESREDRQRRPIRDYLPAFYDDPQVKLEGWFYSVGYRSMTEESKSEHPHKEEAKDSHPKEKQETKKNIALPTPLESVQTESPEAAVLAEVTEPAVSAEAEQEPSL